MLDFSELPRQHGRIAGRYRLRYSCLNVAVRGATFADGVTQGPVEGMDAERLHYAYGSACAVEPYDVETLQSIVAWLVDRDKLSLLAQLRANLIGLMKATGIGSMEDLDASVPDFSVPGQEPARVAAARPSEPAADDISDVEPVLQSLPVIDADVDTLDDLDALRSTAEAMGIAVDGRWRAERLQSEIRKAREIE